MAQYAFLADQLLAHSVSRLNAFIEVDTSADQYGLLVVRAADVHQSSVDHEGLEELVPCRRLLSEDGE